MKKICMILGLFGFVATFSSAAIAQQKIGAVFGRTEANTLFGKVYGHESITLDQLKEAVKNAGDYIYITIKHNQPIFTNRQKQRAFAILDKAVVVQPGRTPDCQSGDSGSNPDDRTPNCLSLGAIPFWAVLI